MAFLAGMGQNSQNKQTSLNPKFFLIALRDKEDQLWTPQGGLSTRITFGFFRMTHCGMIGTRHLCLEQMRLGEGLVTL
jgi:hypothetical protein